MKSLLLEFCRIVAAPERQIEKKNFSPEAKNPQRLSSPLAISRQYFKSDFVFCSAIVVLMLVVNHCLIPGWGHCWCWSDLVNLFTLTAALMLQLNQIFSVRHHSPQLDLGFG